MRRAVAWFAERGIRVQAIMSDNGSAYIAHSYRQALAELGLHHLRIRPYRPPHPWEGRTPDPDTPQRWAYGRLYGSSAERATALPLYLERYTSDDHTALSATGHRHHD